MRRIAVDVGNRYTKYMIGEDLELAKFPTKIMELSDGSSPSGEKVHRISYEGKEYAVGFGRSILGKDRYYTKEYLICLLTGIALSQPREETSIIEKTTNIEVVVAIGVPAGIHEYHQEKIKPYLEGIDKQEITVNDQLFNITINKAVIFPEGNLGSVFPRVREGHNLILDIGSGTINQSEWIDGKIKKKRTTVDACSQFYKDIIADVQKRKGDCFVKEEQIERVIETGIYTETIDKQLIDENLKKYVNNIFDSAQVDPEYPLDCVFLLGGGANMLQDATQDFLMNDKQESTEIVVMENSEYINLMIYKKMLDWIWSKQYGGND